MHDPSDPQAPQLLDAIPAEKRGRRTRPGSPRASQEMLQERAGDCREGAASLCNARATGPQKGAPAMGDPSAGSHPAAGTRALSRHGPPDRPQLQSLTGPHGRFPMRSAILAPAKRIGSQSLPIKGGASGHTPPRRPIGVTVELVGGGPLPRPANQKRLLWPRPLLRGDQWKIP